MFKSTIILSFIINFLLYLVFADVLNAIRLTDRDTYLTIMGSSFLLITILSYCVLIHARISNLEKQVKRHNSDEIEW